MMKNNINTIILTETISHLMGENYKNINYNYMSIDDLVNLTIELNKLQTMDPNIKKYVQKIFNDAMRKEGDDGVVKLFNDMTRGLEIFPVRQGRYSFTPQVQPEDYQEKLEE
ncbi:MAG: hypothetical protein ACOC3V_00185 [bacterium]